MANLMNGAWLLSNLLYKVHLSRQYDDKIVDHSDVVRASPVGAAPTTSSFSTLNLASMDLAKTTCKTRWETFKFLDLVQLILEIWQYDLYKLWNKILRISVYRNISHGILLSWMEVTFSVMLHALYQNWAISGLFIQVLRRCHFVWIMAETRPWQNRHTWLQGIKRGWKIPRGLGVKMYSPLSVHLHLMYLHCIWENAWENISIAEHLLCRGSLNT